MQQLSLTPSITYAYVTYHDIRGIQSFEDQTVIAIKAPPETRLEVPDPKEVGVGQLFLVGFEGRGKGINLLKVGMPESYAQILKF